MPPSRWPMSIVPTILVAEALARPLAELISASTGGVGHDVCGIKIVPELGRIRICRADIRNIKANDVGAG